MSLGPVWVAGSYSVTWNSLALGVMQGSEQSPAIEQQRFGELIDNTNAFGRTPIGQISQGGAAFFQCTMLEYKANTVQTLWPYTDVGYVPDVGTDDWDNAKSLVLTAAAGTLAASSPATVTALHAFLREGYPIRLLYGPILRALPLQMRLFPYYVSGSTGPLRTHLVT
jgi:hypothetical protein